MTTIITNDNKEKVLMNRMNLVKCRIRLNGLLLEKIDDIHDALSQFPEDDPYVKLKKEEKEALRYAIKLLDNEIERTSNEKHSKGE